MREHNHNRPCPHRMKHHERAAFMPVDLNQLKTGDVFVLEGTPHIVVFPPAEVSQTTPQGQVWIVNLHNGWCWPISGSTQVHPAYEVELTFTSGRREG